MIVNKLWSMVRQAAACACVLLAVGCASKGERGGAEHEDAAGRVGGIGDISRFYGEPVSSEREADLLAQDTYYFGYDLYEVTPEDRLSIYAHAKKLIENPRLQIRIEGHTDERGSREYNVALGERRGKAVANILMMKGVPSHQIHVVSYGKEKPSAMGHDESAWKENRRAVIFYE
jgi:peptidoglycan-associated lipoprotein